MEDKQSKMEVEDYLRYTLFMLHKTIVYGIKKNRLLHYLWYQKNICLVFFISFLIFGL